MIIYGLIDADKVIRYVGKTVNIKVRMKFHRRDRSWLAGYVELEQVTEDNWAEREKYWIAFYGLDNLENRSRGGGGWDKPAGFKHTEGARLNMSLAHKGIKLTDEHKRKIGDGSLRRRKPDGSYHSPEAIEKMRQARLRNSIRVQAGKKMSDEFKKKIKDSWVLRRQNYGPNGRTK